MLFRFIRVILGKIKKINNNKKYYLLIFFLICYNLTIIYRHGVGGAALQTPLLLTD